MQKKLDLGEKEQIELYKNMSEALLKRTKIRIFCPSVQLNEQNGKVELFIFFNSDKYKLRILKVLNLMKTFTRKFPPFTFNIEAGEIKYIRITFI